MTSNGLIARFSLTTFLLPNKKWFYTLFNCILQLTITIVTFLYSPDKLFTQYCKPLPFTLTHEGNLYFKHCS